MNFDAKIIDSAKREIKSQREILDEAWKRANFSKEKVEHRFSEALIQLNRFALEVYLANEGMAIERLAIEWVATQEPNIRERFTNLLKTNNRDTFLSEASRLFSNFGIYVQKLEKDLGNMRKARGGSTFREFIVKMLNFIDIQAVKNESKDLERIDIIIPSIEVAKKTPDRAIFLTCKRTLRERWKQEVPSGQMNMRYYLITIDLDISETIANEIKEKSFIAFVPDSLKSERLTNQHWIRALSDLPDNLKKGLGVGDK